MRAQKVEDLSMEDILSSIRKIISEDGKEETPSASVEKSSASNREMPQDAMNHATTPQPPVRQQPVPPLQPEQSNPQARSQHQPDAQLDFRGNRPGTQANSVEHPHVSAQPPAIEQPTPPKPVNSGDVADHSPQPPVFSERREDLDMDSTPRQERQPAPDDQPSSPVEPVFAEKPNPMIRPAVHTPPVPVNTTSEKSAKPVVPVNPANLHQPGQTSSGGIPGFVETKPPVDNDDNIAGKPTTETEAPLHPAITNAKSFVSIQGSEKKPVAESMPEGNETPVFANPQPPVDMPIENLISPGDADRRDVDERRNHPLRRGVDRVESEVRKDLMSPTTTDSVHTAFEQLKNITTENLDSNVQQIIRPMLREWLDNNLPSMVERLVRDEIERVSRGE